MPVGHRFQLMWANCFAVTFLSGQKATGRNLLLKSCTFDWQKNHKTILFFRQIWKKRPVTHASNKTFPRLSCGITEFYRWMQPRCWIICTGCSSTRVLSFQESEIPVGFAPVWKGDVFMDKLSKAERLSQIRWTQWSRRSSTKDWCYFMDLRRLEGRAKKRTY